MTGICEGRVVAITGAANGLGRSHALAFAAQGAKLVINDFGGEVDGTGASKEPAEAVIKELQAMGAEAVACVGDIADMNVARALVQTAIDHYGKLDTLVCNAGILRDRVLANMTEDEWDGVMWGHLRTTFAPSKVAAQYWRDLSKAGTPGDGRIICTSSGAGLFGNSGQTNYGAAKAGIAAFAVIAAKELVRYGVTVNAIAPAARTRMTIPLGMGTDIPSDKFDWASPDNVSPLVVWLGSAESRDVTGRVFEVMGGRIGIVNNWSRGPFVDKNDRWEPQEIGAIVTDMVSKAPPLEPIVPPR